MKKKLEKIIVKISFIMYILLLIWIIVFKFRLDITSLKYIRSINLIPFKNNGFVNGIREPMLNLLLFIPLGMYLKYFGKKYNFLNSGIIILTSFIFEVLEFILHIGVSDITDIIMNILGGLVGMFLMDIVLFKVTKKGTILDKLIEYILIFIPVLMFLALFLL